MRMERELTTKQKREITLSALQRRMRVHGDFPAFSEYITEINTRASNVDTSSADMTNIILKDYALTHKLLRLINSAFYAPYTAGGQISTISQAVFLLGFEQIRYIALGLIVFDHLQNKTQVSELKDSALGSFMSGFIGRDLSSRVRSVDQEEAFLSAMFRNMGRHLAIYLFPREYAEIRRLADQDGLDDDKAAVQVLGLTLSELNAEVLKTWRFPEVIAEAVKGLPNGKPGKPRSKAEVLRNLSALSNEICQLAIHTAPSERNGDSAQALLARYDKTLKLSAAQLNDLLRITTDELRNFCHILNISVGESRLLKKVLRWSSSEEVLQQEAGVDAELGGDADAAGSGLGARFVMDPEQKGEFFTRALWDVRQAVQKGEDMNSVLTMIMEIMHRGLDLANLIIFIRNVAHKRMDARFGLGEEFKGLGAGFHFPLDLTAGLFLEALTQERDIVVRNAADPMLRERIPAWHAEHFRAEAFLLYPIVVRNVPFGMFYADVRDAEGFFKGKYWSFMKTFRNQAVAAIEHAAGR